MLEEKQEQDLIYDLFMLRLEIWIIEVLESLELFKESYNRHCHGVLINVYEDQHARTSTI